MTLPRSERRQFHLQGGNDFAGYFVLDRENIFQIPVVAFGPQMAPIIAIDKLGVDAHPISGPADAAFQNLPHAQLAADLPDIGALPLIGK